MTDLDYEVINIPDFTDDVHDDVELMLNCTGPEILELIASDPKHYLDVVTSYNKTRDGREIYLPDLFNLIITRNPNEYRIKFKVYDNGNWYEVGYSGGNFTEEEVLDAFSKKVNYAINRSADSHRSAILDTLQPGSKKYTEPETIATETSSPFMSTEASSFVTSSVTDMRPQGDQTKLSKIDRFMGRSAPAPVPVSVHVPAPVPAAAPVQTPVPITAPAAAPAVPTQAAIPVSSVLSELDILRTLCPEERKSEYNNLINVLRSKDLFYQSLVNLLPRMSAGQRILISDFLLQN